MIKITQITKPMIENILNTNYNDSDTAKIKGEFIDTMAGICKEENIELNEVLDDLINIYNYNKFKNNDDFRDTVFSNKNTEITQYKEKYSEESFKNLMFLGFDIDCLLQVIDPKLINGLFGIEFTKEDLRNSYLEY